MVEHGKLIERLTIKVITRDLTNPELVKEKEINFGNKKDRQWLHDKMEFWAMTNNQSITLYPLELPVYR